MEHLVERFRNGELEYDSHTPSGPGRGGRVMLRRRHWTPTNRIERTQAEFWYRGMGATELARFVQDFR